MSERDTHFAGWAKLQIQKLQEEGLLEAGRRGPNAWGVSWLDRHGMNVHKQAGKLSEEAYRLPVLCAEASALIGQSRLATSGTYRENSNNPPFVVRGVALAHNGNVYNERELVEKHHLEPETQCDSEVLAQLIAAGRGSLLDRVTWAVEQVDMSSPLSVLAMDETGIVAMRKGQPLYTLLSGQDVYLCSRSFGINSEMLPDGVASFFWLRGEVVARREVR